MAAANERLQKVLDLVPAPWSTTGSSRRPWPLQPNWRPSWGATGSAWGLRNGRKLRVRALSHSAEFGKQMNLVRAIEAAMDEALDQQAVIVYPLPAGATPLVIRAHEELVPAARGRGRFARCPCRDGGNFSGG